MLRVFLLAVAAAIGASGELMLTVYPRQVQPEVSEFFSLNCALLEAEETRVLEISISRQVSEGGKKELVAQLRGPRVAPEAGPGFEGITLLGRISPLESEYGTYLYVMIPNPTVDDLGLYTCDASLVGETGRILPFSASARVTTTNRVTDRLVTLLRDLDQRMDTFNQSLQEIQEQINNVTAEMEAEKIYESPVLVYEVTQTPAPDVSETEVQSGDNGNGMKNATQGSLTDRDRLLEMLSTQLLGSVQHVGVKLDTVLHSVRALETRVAVLEDDGTTTRA